MAKNEIKCPKCGEIFKIDETDYALIVEQVRSEEFEKEIEARVAELKKQFEITMEKMKIEAASSVEQAVKKEHQVAEDKEREVIKLQGLLDRAKTDKDLAVSEAVRTKDETISNKDLEILDLRNQLQQAESQKALALAEANTANQSEIGRLKQELADAKSEIQRISDFKSKLSTKMVGEDLEQHCLNAFNGIRTMCFPKAQFYKDSEIVEGTKGDFIYREVAEDGTPILSIMFEMKNECDTTATKHKNEDFFAKLDKDRTKKGCEFAVLVSMLEQDNDIYNAGILDVSYAYPNMYVVRPQCFITLIHILRKAALQSLAARQELKEYKEREIDYTNFEQNLADWQKGFGYNVDQAKKRHEEAIGEINKAIGDLIRVRDKLLACNKQLENAENKVADMTVKNLQRVLLLFTIKLLKQE